MRHDPGLREIGKMGELGAHQILDINSLPLVPDQQVLIGRKRLDALSELPDKSSGAGAAVGDCLHETEHVLGAMIVFIAALLDLAALKTWLRKRASCCTLSTTSCARTALTRLVQVLVAVGCRALHTLETDAVASKRVHTLDPSRHSRIERSWAEWRDSRASRTIDPMQTRLMAEFVTAPARSLTVIPRRRADEF